MRCVWVLFILGVAALKREVSAGCADPALVEKIKTIFWEKYSPEYFLEKDAACGAVYSVILSTEDADGLPPNIVYSASKTFIYDSYGVPWYFREFQCITDEKKVLDPVFDWAYEREPGIVTYPTRNKEFIYIFNWEKHGLRACYYYNLDGSCEGYSYSVVITIDPDKFKSRDVLCRAINELEEIGVIFNKTKNYYSGFDPKSNKWLDLAFDSTHCIVNEYVKDIDSFMIHIKNLEDRNKY